MAEAEVREEPNFDGSEAKAPNAAASESAVADPDTSIMDPTKGELDLEAGEDPAEALRVRYTGTSNERKITRSEMSGQAATDTASASWTPGSDVAWSWFLELAGSEERAREVLRLHSHEFVIVGPGSEEFWLESGGGEEEFSIGGVVKE